MKKGEYTEHLCSSLQAELVKEPLALTVELSLHPTFLFNTHASSQNRLEEA